MKEQYIGDLKDYYKYSVIELISKMYNKKVLFVWMLTEPDGKNEGNDMDYLKNPDKYLEYNPILFDKLKTITGIQKTLKSIENILENDNYYFYSEKLLSENIFRAKYFNELDQIVLKNKIFLLFFDPDNGTETKSYPKGTKQSNKYLYWDEIKYFWGKGIDMLLFQYRHRYKKYDELIDETIQKIVSELKIKMDNIKIIKTDADLFFIFLRHKYPKNIMDNNELRNKLNISITIITFDELFGKYYDLNGDLYTYRIERINNNIDIGYSIVTQPIFSIIESDLKRITSETLLNIKITKKENRCLKNCNIDLEHLSDCFYDKYGNLYYLNNKTIYKFNVSIKTLSNIFNT